MLSTSSPISSSGAATISPEVAAEKISTYSSQENSDDQPANEEDDEKVREMLANDLRAWQEKFAKASDKGVDDLEERVAEITEKQIETQVRGVGQARLIELEESIKSAINNAKDKIVSVVHKLPEETSEEHEAKAIEQMVESIRAAGLQVKGKAQAVREWKQKFDNETLSLVWAATESTLAVIDNIRDLGLQEVGMKWAWMEGVTYKDWSKYHALRKTFDDWRKEVQSVAWQHEGLAKAGAAADEVENKAMSIAEEAAKELARLRDVGKWKIKARDPSDDFSSKYAPPVAARAGQQVMEKANDVVDQAKNAASSASAYVAPPEPGLGEKISSKFSEAVIEKPHSVVQSMVSAGTSMASQASSYVSEGVHENIPTVGKDAGAGHVPNADNAQRPFHEEVKTRVSENIVSATSAMSEAFAVETPSVSVQVAEADSASSIGDTASSIASQASKKVWGGAAAQKIKHSTGPILDDDVIEDMDKTGFSDTVQSMIKDAGDNLSDMTKAVREALLKTPSTQGSMESVTSIASEQYSRALSAASSVLYGTQQSGSEGLASVASKKYVDAVSA